MAKKIGIMTCIHASASNAARFLRRFEKENVDLIVLNGDLGDNYKEIKKVLNVFKRTKIKTLVIPGSHEPYKDYYKAIKTIKNNKNVIDLSSKIRINFEDYNLIVFPGSDAIYHTGGFLLANDNKHKMKREKILKRYIKKDFRTIILNDLRRFIKKNKENILIMHIPPKFKGNKSIDVANFGVVTKNCFFRIKNRMRLLEKTDIFPLKMALNMKSKGLPIKIQTKNVGNEYLKKLIKQLKIKKFVCGHIHESGGRAVILSGKKLKQNKWSKELFYNTGSVKEGKAGIIYLENKLVKFKNLII